MEIRLMGTAFGCVAQQDIMAGLAVKLVPDVTGNATGAWSNTSFNKGNVVIGAVLPVANNDKDARFVAAWAVNNKQPPLYQTLPTLTTGGVPYSLREFVQGSSNLPATNITVRMTDPRLQEEQIIPSGSLMLAYDEGIYTVTSGCFANDYTYATGDKISVMAGGRWYKDNGGVVARVFEFEYSAGEVYRLTIKTEDRWFI